MVDITIINKTKWDFKFGNLLQNIADNIIKNEDIKGNSSTSIIIVGDEKIKSLAKQFKDKDYVTDVLSFENDWKHLQKLTGINEFGDIYINKNKILSQAKEYNHSIKREFAYLFAHGLLHLIGYDHLTDNDEKAMHLKIENVLNILGVTR